MTLVENLFFEDILNPDDYEYFLTRQCTCNNNWKTIAIEKTLDNKEILGKWKYSMPTKNIANKQNIIVYSKKE